MRLFRDMVLCACCVLFACGAFAVAQEEVPVFRFEEPGQPADPVHENRDKGLMAFQDSLYDVAEVYFKDALKACGTTEPAFGEVSLLLARTYLKRGKKGDAAQAASILDAHGATSEGLNDIALSAQLTFARAQCHALNGEWARCRDLCQSLATQDIPLETRREAILLCADSLANLSDYSTCVQFLNNYLQEVPEDRALVEFQLRLVEAYIALGQNQEAQKVLDDAVQSNDTANALLLDLHRLRNLSILRESEKAQKLYEEKLRPKLPGTADSHWWNAVSAYADMLFAEQKSQLAKSAYQDAKGLATNDTELIHALSRLTRLQIKEGASNNAGNYLEELKRKAPESPELADLTDALARQLKEAGQYNSAADYFQKLIEYPQTRPEVRFAASLNRAQCLALSGQWEAARDAYLAAEKYTDKPEERANALVFAAMVMEKVEKPTNGSSAVQLYKMAADRYPQTADGTKARLQQAALLAEQSKFQEAAEVYNQFEQEHPDDERCEEAKLLRGVNRRKGAITPAAKSSAADFLADLAPKCKDANRADQAIFEAYQAWLEAGDFEKASNMLTKLVSKKESLLHAEALFRRVMLHFSEGKIGPGRDDAKSYFEERGHNEASANELHIAVGDTYVNEQKWGEAQAEYLNATNNNVKPELLPLAWYEAAFCCYQMKNYPQTITWLEMANTELDKQSNLSADQKMLRGRIHYLWGDCLAMQSKYEEAGLEYQVARADAGDSELGWNALGRQGDMLLHRAISLGNLKNDAETAKIFKEADQCFQKIAENFMKTGQRYHPLALKAQYRLAYSLKNQKKDDLALDEYRKIYFDYRNYKGDKVPLLSFYFENAVVDMCEILEKKGDMASLDEAARCYDLLAKQNPMSGTARERLKQLRKPNPSSETKPPEPTKSK
ncbi:MAG: tetratricopeptide repeat protein [Victivallales bacterium]|nr:tetratricopeptide repeat protein [Victivallales bacterium]